MKGISELTDFYYESLFPTLKELEIERKKLRYKILLIGGFYTLMALYIFSKFFLYNLNLESIAISVFAYLGVGTFIYKFLAKDYTKKFKNSVIEPLIHAVDKNLNYSAHMHIPQ